VSLSNAQAIHQTAEVSGASHGVEWLLGFGEAVPTQIVGDDSEVVSERRRKIVENVRVVETAVDEDQHRAQTTPVEVMKSNTVGGHESALVGGSVRPCS
jgi:hypothetical protein